MDANETTNHPSWHDAIRDRRFVLSLTTALASLAITLTLVRWACERGEIVGHAVLADPLLAWLPTYELTTPLFIAIYGSIVYAIVCLAPHPTALARALHVYWLMLGLRALCLWVTPFSAPPGMIALTDPVINTLSGDAPYSNDLMFSGHTSMLTLLTTTALDRPRRILFAVMTAFVAVGVLVQHVHYTIDVIVGVLAPLAATRVADFLLRQE